MNRLNMMQHCNTFPFTAVLYLLFTGQPYSDDYHTKFIIRDLRFFLLLALRLICLIENILNLYVCNYYACMHTRTHTHIMKEARKSRRH